MSSLVSNNSSILIVMLGAIGDVVRAFPLAARIKKNYPNSRITWAVETSSVNLVRRCLHVDAVIEFKRSGGLPAFFSFMKELRANTYDISIDLQRHFKSGVISFFSRAPHRLGFNYINSRELNWLFNNTQIEAVDHFEDKIEQIQRFGDYCGLDTLSEPYDFGLQVTDQDRKNLIKKLREIDLSYDLSGRSNVLFFIGSVWKTKRWMPEYFSILAETIYKNTGMVSVLIGAPHERNIADSIVSACNVPIIDLVGKTTLDEFPVLCTLAPIAVGADSGPMHIASAMGQKVISVWGPTSPTRSKPYRNLEYVIKSPIGCQGCYMRSCPDLDVLCLKEIKPQVVYQMFERAIR